MGHNLKPGCRNAVKVRSLPFYRILDTDDLRQWALNPASPYILTAPIEAYDYYISHQYGIEPKGYLSQGPGIPEGAEYEATLGEDRDSIPVSCCRTLSCRQFAHRSRP